MVKRKTENRPHQWLQPLWDRKRHETVKRVRAAVDHLLSKETPVTLIAIRDAVKTLFRVPISTNTIQRNDQAYEIYLEHAKKRRTQGRDRELTFLLRNTKEQERIALRAKINRLRRESKDALITRLFQLETREHEHSIRERNLREEILRLTLKGSSKKAAK